jgi:hypothetical protein
MWEKKNNMSVPVELMRELDSLLSKVSNLATYHNDLMKVSALAQHLRVQLQESMRLSV